MKTTLILLVSLLVTAAAVTTLLSGFVTGPRVTQRIDERVTALQASVDGLRAAIRAQRAGGVDSLAHGGEAAESRADGQRPGAMTTNQRLNDIEGQIFDLERNVRRDLLQMHQKLLRRFDELEARLPGAESRVANPATIAAELAKEGVLVNVADGTVEVPAFFGRPTRTLDFVAVAPGGSTHETMVVASIRPGALKQGLLALGLKAAPRDDDGIPQFTAGDPVYIYLAWEGRPHPVRVESLIKNIKTGVTLPLKGFVFSGSREFTDRQTFDRRLAADLSKQLIAIVWDYGSEAVVGCAMEETQDRNVWSPDPDALPQPETKARLLFRKSPRPEWETK